MSESVRELGARADAELPVGPRQRALHRVLGDEKGGGNLAVGAPLGDERGDPLFGVRQLVARRVRGRRSAPARLGSGRPRAAPRPARSVRARPLASAGDRRAVSRAAASCRARAASARAGTDPESARARPALARCSLNAPSRSPWAASSSPRHRARIASAHERSSAWERFSHGTSFRSASASSPTAISASSVSARSSRWPGSRTRTLSRIPHDVRGTRPLSLDRRARAR